MRIGERGAAGAAVARSDGGKSLLELAHLASQNNRSAHLANTDQSTLSSDLFRNGGLSAAAGCEISSTSVQARQLAAKLLLQQMPVGLAQQYINSLAAPSNAAQQPPPPLQQQNLQLLHQQLLQQVQLAAFAPRQAQPHPQPMSFPYILGAGMSQRADTIVSGRAGAPVPPIASTSNAAATAAGPPPGNCGSPRKMRAGVPQSDFRGVSWDRSVNTWRCKVNSVHVGYFDSETEAARAYDEATLSLHQPGCGMQLRLNFPLSDYKDKPLGSITYATKRDGRARGSSQYRGVLWDKASKSWRAKIKHKGHTKYLGLFQDEEAAGRAYDTAALQLRGTTAKLNFSENHPEAAAANGGTSSLKSAGGGSAFGSPTRAPSDQDALRGISTRSSPASSAASSAASSPTSAKGAALGRKRSPTVDLEDVAKKYARVAERHASRRERYQQACSKLLYFDKVIANKPSPTSQEAPATPPDVSPPEDASNPALAADHDESSDDGLGSSLLNRDALKILLVNSVQSTHSAAPDARAVKQSDTRTRRGRSGATATAKDAADAADDGASDDEDGAASPSKTKDASGGKPASLEVDLPDLMREVQAKVAEEVVDFLRRNRVRFREGDVDGNITPDPAASKTHLL